MTDLPLHEATVGILRHFGDPAYFPPNLYVHNFGHSNQLFFVLAWALSYLVSTDLACKVVVALSVVGICAGAGRLADHLGVTRWAALIVAPFALGWTFVWGFVANLTGLALFLAVLPDLDGFVARPSWRGVLKTVVILTCLWFAHQAMLVFACGAILIFAASYPLAIKSSSLRLLPAAFAVALTFFDARTQEALVPAELRINPPEFDPLSKKLASIPEVLLGGRDHGTLAAFFALLFAAMGALLYARYRAHEGPWRLPVREFLRKYRFELLASGLLLGYLVMPFSLHGITLIYQRFLLPALAIGVISAAPRLPVRPHRLGRLLAGLLPVATLLIVLPDFADSSESCRELDKLLLEIDRGSAVAQIYVGAGGSDHRVFSAATVATRVVAERGGRALFTFSFSTYAPAMLRPEYEWLESQVRVSKVPLNFRPAYDFKHYRYAIVHCSEPQCGQMLAVAMVPEGRLVDVSGEWLLFESTLPVVALDTPGDLAMPDNPRPESLYKRFKSMRRPMDLQAPRAVVLEPP